MAFDFPNSPTVGQVYTSGGVTYTWDGQAWRGGPVSDVGQYVKKAGDTMVGPLVLAADPANIMEASTKQYADKNAVKAHRAGAGTTGLGTGVWTKVNLAAISSGVNLGGWTLNTQNLIAPKKGIYLVGASVQIVTPAAITAIECGIALNGGITAPFVRSRVINTVTTAYAYMINCQTLVGLDVGDALSLVAFAAAAGTTVTDGNDVTFMWATMLAAQ